jgi:hypothetical protein
MHTFPEFAEAADLHQSWGIFPVSCSVSQIFACRTHGTDILDGQISGLGAFLDSGEGWTFAPVVQNEL